VRLLFVSLNRSAAYGGVERWMIDAGLGLGARGHQCVLLGRPGAPWIQAARGLGLRVRDDHHGAWAMRVLRMCAAMRRERPDVVVAKGKKAARMAAWGRMASPGTRIALFFGLTHELDPRRWIDRYTWRRVGAGIALAREAARWYVAAGFGPPDKVHVLWKGVDLVPYDDAIVRRAATRAGLGLADDEVAVGTVCRLAWQKGLDQLVAAVRILRATHPGVRVFVVGDGRERPRVEAEAAGLAGTITLLGQRDDVPALMAAFDVFVQPSRREVMVQTTLEAMAAGRALVSTRTTGAAEAVIDGQSGILVDVGDATALARAIATLADDPARRATLGRAARRRVEETFTLPHMLARAEGLLTRIAGRQPADASEGDRPVEASP
jgi:glycosyltransferase involved in cell wall biosynthesis